MSPTAEATVESEVYTDPALKSETDAAPKVSLTAAPGDDDYQLALDPRLKEVEWRDLVKPTRWQAFKETVLSLPWIAATMGGFFLMQFTGQWWWGLVALLCSFYLFLTGLRQVHNAFHYAVGIPRRGCDLLMFGLSIVMTGSMHAVQINHLHHHRHCLSDEDVEGFTAKLKWWQAMIAGPYFFWRLHSFALKTAKPNQMRWIKAELIGNVVWYAFVFGVMLPLGQWWLAVFVVTMWAGQCGTGFFAVWTVHHDCDADHELARTQRGWLKNFISYQMFHHVEHHLFPAVPTCNWAELGRRLDEVIPKVRDKNVY